MIIEQRFNVLKKQPGRYHGFPTLVRQERKLWLACRSGIVNLNQAHGIKGSVLLFSADLSKPDQWHAQGPLFTPSSGTTGNELDAILSMPEPGLFFLATRDYERKLRNDVYLSRGRNPALTERLMLTSISDHYAICFGHIRKTLDGGLLMPGYRGYSDEPDGTPVLLRSRDHGKSWQLIGNVASSTAVGTRLTEFSLGHLGETNWTVLIRNETPPFFLYRAETCDDGLTWSFPEETQLKGHAPMIIETQPTNRHVVLYRDLSATPAGVAVAISDGNGGDWRKLGRLAEYPGSIYDGGYGDLVHLDGERFLAVYYLCDHDGAPWIEGCVFKIG